MNESYNKLKYFEQTEGIPAQVYYHYTSLDALYAIVQSHTFRLMSLKSSNDRTELFYKPESFIADVTRLRDAEKDERIKEYYSLMEISVDEHKAAFLKDLKAKKQPYALCLSSQKDNLTHWDRYANGCAGVCIGLNIKALDILYRRTETFGFALGLLDLGQALYTQDNIDHWIKYEMMRGLRCLKQLNEASKEKDIGETVRESGHLFMRSACSNVMKFAKTSAFFDEDEFRIYFDPKSIKETRHLIDGMSGQVEADLYMSIRKNFLSLVDCLKISDEGFALTRAGIRGFHNLCLDKIWGSGVIPEIVLGPMCVQNKSELQRFLKANGLEGTKISISNVPIR